ncbi:MAG: hypothetical protein IJS52_08755 [Bacilli bacterium]|nr:hypothetical protein [Bacilli bacterium]
MKKYIVCGILGIAALLALLSGIFFNVVSTTGYLTGSPYNVGVTVLAILAAVLLAGSMFTRFLGVKIAMLLQVVAAALLAVAFVMMLMDKANFLGDSFIPMERPAEFHSGIALTYTSLIFLAVSALFTSVAAFIGNPEKK